MAENGVEPKITICGFNSDNAQYSTGSTPFQDVELFFYGYHIEIKSQVPKTRKEFEKIFNDYIKEEKYSQELEIKLRKKQWNYVRKNMINFYLYKE